MACNFFQICILSYLHLRKAEVLIKDVVLFLQFIHRPLKFNRIYSATRLISVLDLNIY